MNIPSLDFGLGEDINMLRDAVKAFADAEIAPRAAEIDRANEFPADLWKKFGDMGLLGMTAGEEYGGTNMGYLAHIVALEEISRASASVGLSYGSAAPEISAQAHFRRPRWRAGDVRAECRFRCRVDEIESREEGRPLRFERFKNVDHQRRRCRYAGGLRQD
jgi:alkylation response protein AidB-like acyl-CoA dehydrogenase